jgi:DNA alkylation damage repair protein AlkB
MIAPDTVAGLLILPSFLPPSVQKELLSRLLHRDLSDEKHQTNVHMFYDMPYPHGTSCQEEASSENASFFSYSPKSKITFTPKDASVHKPLSISKFMEKSLRWVTLGGQYDWTNKVYPDEVPPAFPADIKDLLEGLFPDMKAQAAIVNLYSPGDTLSLHRDVSEESDKGLVSISLGCACLFVVGLGRDSTDHVVVRLRSGDAVFMSKETRFAWHGVPKILPDTCPEYLSSWPAEAGKYEEWRGWMRNKRVNLNVRQMFD